MITLWFTNSRADKREWNKWRRETLIKLCSDAVTEAREAASLCESALTQTRHAYYLANMAASAKSCTRVGAISEQLYLINANFLADTCASMRDAGEALSATNYESPNRSDERWLPARQGNQSPKR